MTKRMLIDATHAEETRVVVLDGSHLEDYDVETATKRQLKGNIYLAKVVRVEPSLQAAFVEYGGNRHGFLAFAEIHPDYYQIPIADRQKLLAMQEEAARAAEEAEEEAEKASEEARSAAAEVIAMTPQPELSGEATETETEEEGSPAAPPEPERQPAAAAAFEEEQAGGAPAADPEEPAAHGGAGEGPSGDAAAADEETLEAEAPLPETVGGEAEISEDLRPQRIPAQFLRQYKIQEVIHRRQILLVQVVKEERGAKGAALTTYISLAGRYCVLMPNSPRGGGISRKITSPTDRRRLKEITAELAIPSGMGLIVRTAGANRPKPEIRRDCEYLLRLWDEIRETVMKSVAPALIYEEASLIKRAIRDVYSRDIEEVLVDGEPGWQAARDFMRTLMPTHARKVQLWKDPAGRSLFSHEQVEAELDAVLSPTVPLRSGGSLVINQAEALVAIDVNSGRSTRERNIEETALRTNLEAAEEVGRQLRLRDLAGLIVIDFIDMESRKHNGMVERRLKDALKNDRARVQVGHISHFGLLEMSRQRLRPSLTETSFSPCPHCGGTGHVRSVESAAVRILRLLEDDASRRRGGELLVHSSGPVAIYILNHKRAWLNEIETRHGIEIGFVVEENQPLSFVRIERLRAGMAVEPGAVAPPPAAEAPAAEPEGAPAGEEPEAAEAEAGPAETQAGEEGEEGDRRRRRRRRRRRHREETPPAPVAAGPVPPEEAEQPEVPEMSEAVVEPAQGRRRAPRAGGRGRGARSTAARPESRPTRPYPAGPTPADPFASAALDFLDALEAAAESTAMPSPASAPAVHAEPPAPVAFEETAPPERAAEEAVVVEAEPELVATQEAPAADEVVRAAAPVDDRPPAPAVQPIVIGSDEAVPLPKKRGWWQR